MNIKPRLNTSQHIPQAITQTNKVTAQKLPRFLYHFTNADAAKEILEEGLIHTSYDGRGIMDKGVFMVDFQNLVKSWSKLFVTAWSKEISLLTCLLGQVAKGEEKIACFRIPSQELWAKTVIRSQNELKKTIDSGEDNAPFFSKCENYKLYQRNGHSIEYIHFGEIKVDNKNLVGITNLTKNLYDAFNEDEFDETDLNEESLKILNNLFAEEPERKSFESINTKI